MTQQPALPPYADLRQWADDLIVSWDGLVQRGVNTAPDKLRRFLVTFGLSAHVYRLAPGALMVLDADLAVEAVPIVRVMYECAITAQWCYLVDGAAEAFFNRQAGERSRFLDNLPHLGIPTVMPDEVARAKASIDASAKFDTDATATFKAICMDLEPGGLSAYTHYQLMCSVTHASDRLLDFYLADTDQPPGVGLRQPPERMSREGWLALVIGSMLWAGQAVEYADQDHVRALDLQRVASAIGLDPRLRASDRAVGRATRLASADAGSGSVEVS